MRKKRNNKNNNNNSVSLKKPIHYRWPVNRNLIIYCKKNKIGEKAVNRAMF